MALPSFLHLSLTKKDAVRIAWAALFAFVGAFIPLASGIGKFHNFSDAEAAALALLPAALAAAFSAVKNGVLADGTLAKG